MQAFEAQAPAHEIAALSAQMLQGSTVVAQVLLAIEELRVAIFALKRDLPWRCRT
jgi:hypothetical protein